MKYRGFLFYEMNTRPGMWIPQEIIQDHKLDWINKVLLSEIISLSKLEKGCFASNETFGKFLNLHRGNISKRISFLVDEGYIKVELIKSGEKRTLRIITPHKGVSDNATSSKRIRTEECADTHKGVSVSAQRSERKRSTTIPLTTSVITTDTKSGTNTGTNTQTLIEQETNKLLEKFNIK